MANRFGNGKPDTICKYLHLNIYYEDHE